MVRFGLIFGLVLLFSVHGESQLTLENNHESLRLPNDTKPITYDIHITTNIHRAVLVFTGRVSITLEVVNDTDKIVIHASNLHNIKVTLIDLFTEMELPNVIYECYNRTEFMVIYSAITPLELKSGNKYLLIVSYKGVHGKGNLGFYSSYYKTKISNVPIAVTQFQPNGARLAFPCYDEPGFKANFKVSITHASHYNAISNMPETRMPIKRVDGMAITIFETTPVIPVYSLAFVVSDYHSSFFLYNNIIHRVFYPKSSTYFFGDESVRISGQILDTLERYFDVAYPNNKIDHISVSDRDGRAMENFGLIIYKFGWVLPHLRGSKVFNLKTMSVIAHELTHQWFGNLVTPKWWTWSWLNEGLSTFYSYKVIDFVYPSLKSMDYFITQEMGPLTWSPRRETQLPLTRYVETSDEIATQFTDQVYFKAAYILQMFEHALTPWTFRKGVISYLKKYEFSTVDEDDFLECLQEAATEDEIPYFEEPGSVAKIFKSWTNHPDYPLVTVTRNYKEGTFTLKQNGFLHNGEHYWFIPITFTTSKYANFNSTKTMLIFPNVSEIVVDPRSLNMTLSEGEWIILNINQVAPYRIFYDKRNWNLISDALKKNPKVISSYSKAQLLRDMKEFYERNHTPFNDLLNFFSYLEKEDDVVPGIEALLLFNYFNSELVFNRFYFANFQLFSNNVMEKLYDRVGPSFRNVTTPAEELFRLHFIQFYCELNKNKCPATELLKDFIRDDISLDDDLLNLLPCLANTTNWEKREIVELKSRLNHERDEIVVDRRPDVQKALSCVKSFIII